MRNEDTMRMKEQIWTRVVPSERQLAYQATEFYVFFHFGMNTYTDREWGDGTENPAVFNPVDFDGEQWVVSAKTAGMKGVILTCKHHDGFCLWPSKYTKHSVAYSPWKDGNGNIVREISEACRKHDMKFGVYLSPWDRNQPCYGSGKAYDDYYVAQLTELLTEYGMIFSVWLDGACGEGPNGKKQIYDWDRYYACVRRYQPDACIAVCGPDIRWCGNEAGDVRVSEWSVVPARVALAESVQEQSQQNDDEEFRNRRLTSDMEDLGSRTALEGETDLIWYPAEVNTSIRPGWFYHASEDDKVRTLEELKDIYIGSVGGNATFLLNVPPMPNGLLNENDVYRLREFGEWKRKAFECNLVENALLSADSEDERYPLENVKQDLLENWYQPEKKRKTTEIRIKLPQKHEIGYVVLREAVQYSQRVEAFSVYAGEGDERRIVYEGTVIGYKKIIHLEDVNTDILTISIREVRVCPLLAFIGVYEKAE